MNDTETTKEGVTETVTLPTQAEPRLDPAEIDWRLTERKALGISKANSAVPRAFSGKPGDILAVWMMADELGISRMAALRSMYVVNGKPQLSGELMMAIARGAGCRIEESIEEEEEELVATCKVTLPSGEVVSATFSKKDAEHAGLWGGSDPWKRYPKRMLQMRARGFAMRDAIPDKMSGIYAPGELGDVVEGDYREVN